MISKEELRRLFEDLESDRVERTIAQKDLKKASEAICAFSNDLPDHRLPGYYVVGVDDKGNIKGLQISDELLKDLASQRDNGNILPVPVLTVHKLVYPEGEIAVVEVQPHPIPPVRYQGKVLIRIGPRKAMASPAEERLLSERANRAMRTYDSSACPGSKMGDLNLDIFKITYLPQAIAPEVLEENNRPVDLQLSSLHFLDLDKSQPTVAGILLFGINPLYFIPGAYIQYVEFDGPDLSGNPVDERRFSGDLLNIIRQLEALITAKIRSYPKPGPGFQEKQVEEYPYWAVRELLLNAIMHRDYQSHAPIRFYWFADHVEIQNPGGLYGTARPENFPNQNDYRNPVLAEALKNLGFVNRFSRGVIRAAKLLEENGNEQPVFTFNQLTYFNVRINKRPDG